jgi:hypothetical protein
VVFLEIIPYNERINPNKPVIATPTTGELEDPISSPIPIENTIRPEKYQMPSFIFIKFKLVKLLQTKKGVFTVL